MEIATDTAIPDRQKASLYAEAGVSEYWIVLAEREAVEVYRRPLNGTYQEWRTYGRGEIIPNVNVFSCGEMLVDAWFS